MTRAEAITLVREFVKNEGLVRHMLSVEAATLLNRGPDFARAVVEIGVLGGVVLVLALAAFVLRERRRDTEDAGVRAVQEQVPSSE